ncbi:MAG: acylneuraminate cytidylyltransferase family protein, partial [Actinobacteria bacterium]|nr:acylneuraminate cytidylyltransferase family protein [Actinomycetota bacterium]
MVAGVFARGGSKGVPNKNLRIVGGQSLIQRAVIQAKQARHVTRVLCSTDSPQIADEARRFG